MKLRYTTLFVDNVEDAMSFYTAAFGFKQKMLHESGKFGELDTGDTVLAFSAANLVSQLGKTPGAPSTDSPVFQIAVETNDVAGAVKAALDAGATLVRDAQDMDWGQTTAYVSDKNGFLIEIGTPIG